MTSSCVSDKIMLNTGKYMMHVTKVGYSTEDGKVYKMYTLERENRFMEVLVEEELWIDVGDSILVNKRR